MKKLNNSIFIIVVLFLLSSVGCASFNNVSTESKLYKSLSTATTLYNTTYDVIQELDNQGKIKEEDKEKIQKFMSGAELSLKTASDALEIYVIKPSSSNEELVRTSIDSLEDFIENVYSIIE